MRRTCLYNSELIGIEVIYTVINGKQINIPGVREKFRELGKQNLLFCPCGCGTNLIVEASEAQLRTQHFKVKAGTRKGHCAAIEEDDTTFNSKIVLKCWFDDKLKSEQLKCRVPISSVCDSDRKFEFTCFDFSRNLGVCYWNRRGNIESDKVDEIEDNSKTYKAFYIADIHNAGTCGQYPEFMIKVQKRQGYNLYLDLNDNDKYEYACLSARAYVQDRFGLWHELIIIEGKLSEFTFSDDSKLLHNNESVYDKAKLVIADFEASEQEKKRIEDEKREQERLKEEHRRKQHEEEMLKREKELEERQRKEDAFINDAVEKYKQEAKARFEKNVANKSSAIQNLNQQEEKVFDLQGKRWVKCKFCGKEATEENFCELGGQGTVNMGICYECKNAGKIQEQPTKPVKSIDTDMKCPECGSKLVVKDRGRGPYLRCSNYSRCSFWDRIG